MSTCTAVQHLAPEAALDLYCGLLVCVSLRSSKKTRLPNPDIKKPDQEIGLRCIGTLRNFFWCYRLLVSILEIKFYYFILLYLYRLFNLMS